MIRGPKKTVSVVMPLELYERIKVRAGAEDRSVPSYIRQVLKHCLRHGENNPEALTDE